MPLPIAAITAGAQIFGGLSSFFGGDSTADAALARSNAIREYGKNAVNAVKQQRSYLQQRAAANRSTYGDIEQNQIKYYSNLDPDKIKNKALAANARTVQQYERKYRGNLAKRGLTNTGVELQFERELAALDARNKANIIESAEDVAAQRRLPGFQIAVNERQNIENQIAGSYGAESAAYNSTAAQLAGLPLGESKERDFGGLTRAAEGLGTLGDLL